MFWVILRNEQHGIVFRKGLRKNDAIRIADVMTSGNVVGEVKNSRTKETIYKGEKEIAEEEKEK